MNFFKIIATLIIILLSVNNYVFADTNSDSEQNIIEKAKKINSEIKKKQAEKSANIASEIGGEEPLPLNDPFAGDAATGGSKSAIVSGSEEEKLEMSLYNFKLVGIIQGKFEGYVSLINAVGDLITLKINEELSEGVKLVELRKDEAIFQKDESSYLTINFKNQIKETAEIN
tara:strand:+ start:1666 stop:2181 length:516 start_codon:yes stop_codon:yes gene_type:complete